MDAFSCSPGSYVSVALTLTSNRVCSGCEAGTFSNATNAVNCTVVQTCVFGEEQKQAPTASSDRVCGPCELNTTYYDGRTSRCELVSVCPSQQEETKAPTLTSNRECAPCQLGFTYFDSITATCRDVTVCQFGEEEKVEPTITTDRICGECELAVTYYNEASQTCRQVSVCPTGTVVAREPTLVSDVECTTGAYVCKDGQTLGDDSQACNCTNISSACKQCERHEELEAKYSLVLSMLDALPQDFVPIRTVNYDDEISDEIVHCRDLCVEESQCIGFTVTYSSGNRWSCTLVSSYRDRKSKTAGARFYTIPRCQSCAAHHVVDGFTCSG